MKSLKYLKKKKEKIVKQIKKIENKVEKRLIKLKNMYGLNIQRVYPNYISISDNEIQILSIFKTHILVKEEKYNYDNYIGENLKKHFNYIMIIKLLKIIYECKILLRNEYTQILLLNDELKELNDNINHYHKYALKEKINILSQKVKDDCTVLKWDKYY